MTDSTRLKMQEIISSLIDNYGLVFWYDAEGDMQDFARRDFLKGAIAAGGIVATSRLPLHSCGNFEQL